MSRHTFKTERGGKTLVTMGWDRPLQELFLRVERGAPKLAPLYDSLGEEPGKLSLEHFREVLTRLGVAAPESLFVEVRIDQERDAGNRIVIHHTDGTFETLNEG